MSESCVYELNVSNLICNSIVSTSMNLSFFCQYFSRNKRIHAIDKKSLWTIRTLQMSGVNLDYLATWVLSVSLTFANKHTYTCDTCTIKLSIWLQHLSVLPNDFILYVSILLSLFARKIGELHYGFLSDFAILSSFQAHEANKPITNTVALKWNCVVYHTMENFEKNKRMEQKKIDWFYTRIFGIEMTFLVRFAQKKRFYLWNYYSTHFIL